MFRVAKQLVRKNRDVVGAGCVRDNTGKILVEEEKLLEVWKEHYERISNEEFSWDREGLTEVKICEFVGDLAPFIAHLINASTRTGSFPSDQKCAMVTPILKKISLDPWDLLNYRPVSNLSFISKILERSVYTQLNGYLHAHNLLPAKQSAYRKFHSTETTLIDILCDVHSAVDAGQLTLLALLDQSAAFDVIDHQILFERLQHSFGLSGKVLEWIRSYLTNRSFYVKFNGISSSISSLICGIPQGSVLGPLLFILYTAELISLVEEHGFNAHTHADDLQIYGHTNTDQAPYLVQRLSNCIDAVKDWMAKNRLRLNPAKTELIWLGSSYHLQHAPITREPLLISGTSILPSKQVRNLGVILECDLSMTAPCQQTPRYMFLPHSTAPLGSPFAGRGCSSCSGQSAHSQSPGLL